jgi:hypothetical protein
VLGPFQYFVWIASALLEAAVLVCALSKGALRRYIYLNLYMAGSLIANFTRFQVLTHYGIKSKQYFYFYYYSDALLTIGLYFALASLYLQVFEEMKVERYVRQVAVLLLAGTAFFSYLVVQQSSEQLLMTTFVTELSQNLYFVGVVLTYVLWGAMLKLRETRARLIQVVLSLGVYFSIFAANYALRNLYPSLEFIWPYLTPTFGCLLPLAWAYAFWNLPEESRLAPSRLAMVPR